VALYQKALNLFASMLLLFQSYLVYLVLLLGALVLSVYWRRRRRKTKLPFDPKIERVRRTAGEGARRKIDELSEKIEGAALAAFFAPIAVGASFLVAIQLVKPTGLALEIVIWAVPVFCLGLLIYYVVRFSRLVIERSDWRLGQFGERNVADHLETLRHRGWRVFHDVPAENKGTKFNIDHVVVGPGGVFAVETKTPRRHEVKYGGKEEHVVEYDGEKLRWPNGSIDYDKPRRTVARASWLLKWMQGQNLPVKEVIPLLAIPWWFVRTVRTDTLYVEAMNPGQLAGAITSYERRLSDNQISVIAAKLDQHCCDVDFEGVF
jgi:hypothetical protein